MDLVILIALLVIVIAVFRDIKWVTYIIGIIEIFLRLINYIGNNIGIEKFQTFVNNIFSNSIFSIIDKYTTGLINTILTWGLVIFLVWFLIYLILYLFKRK